MELSTGREVDLLVKESGHGSNNTICISKNVTFFVNHSLKMNFEKSSSTDPHQIFSRGGVPEQSASISHRRPVMMTS